MSVDDTPFNKANKTLESVFCVLYYSKIDVKVELI